MIQKAKVAIGLGCNLGNRLGTLKEAAEILKNEFLENAVSSSVYETAPWGITEQPAFLNAVIVGLSEWKPPAIVNYLKTVETQLGRTKRVRNGPREIDLDLLIHADTAFECEGVIVPHPGIAERDFVLVPLVEVWGNWIHPQKKKTVGKLFEEFSSKNPVTAKLFAKPLFD